MPRQSRKKSNTGIYHIMLRGLDKRDIFLDDEDREVFLSLFSKAKEKSHAIIYGYCLMDNHVHILMKEGSEHIGESIKRISVGYVQWHNLKYERTGHLFQNRYKSEVVEDDTYFLTVLRYIHQNPVKAGMVKNIFEYKWSSCTYYTNETKRKLVSVEMGKSFFPNQDRFSEFMKMSNTDQCLEYEIKIRYTDEKLKNEISKIHKPELISNLTKKERDNIIREIKEHTGASIRQISRVLGIGRGIVEQAMTYSHHLSK